MIVRGIVRGICVCVGGWGGGQGVCGVRMGARERLANTHDMKIPQIIEFMDMGENMHQNGRQKEK